MTYGRQKDAKAETSGPRSCTETHGLRHRQRNLCKMWRCFILFVKHSDKTHFLSESLYEHAWRKTKRKIQKHSIPFKRTFGMQSRERAMHAGTCTKILENWHSVFCWPDMFNQICLSGSNHIRWSSTETCRQMICLQVSVKARISLAHKVSFLRSFWRTCFEENSILMGSCLSAVRCHLEWHLLQSAFMPLSAVLCIELYTSVPISNIDERNIKQARAGPTRIKRWAPGKCDHRAHKKTQTAWALVLPPMFLLRCQVPRWRSWPTWQNFGWMQIATFSRVELSHKIHLQLSRPFGIKVPLKHVISSPVQDASKLPRRTQLATLFWSRTGRTRALC